MINLTVKIAVFLRQSQCTLSSIVRWYFSYVRFIWNWEKRLFHMRVNSLILLRKREPCEHKKSRHEKLRKLQLEWKRLWALIVSRNTNVLLSNFFFLLWEKHVKKLNVASTQWRRNQDFFCSQVIEYFRY